MADFKELSRLLEEILEQGACRLRLRGGKKR